MNKWLELIVGLVLVIVPVLWVLNLIIVNNVAWSMVLLTIVISGILFGVILLGLMFIMLGIGDIATA